MAKSKKKSSDEQEAPTQGGQTISITGGSIKDEFCSYSYEVISGMGKGDTHNVKGGGIIDPDLTKAIQAFNPHLAHIDDIFAHSGMEIGGINQVKNHELTALYDVTGFKIKGAEEQESIILYGTKQVNCSGERMTIETPKIPLDNLSSYPFYKELKKAADKAREEVKLYAYGKCTVLEEETDDENQLTIADNLDEAEVD